MTNYEELLQKLSPEVLADLTTQLVVINNERLCYLTSTGQLFPQERHEEAVRYQYEWLMSLSQNAQGGVSPEATENTAAEPNLEAVSVEQETTEVAK